ncbi:MAG: DNA internalization-related competence protein ComEC/Rec2 [Desulfatitalea sp.]|nr:DNA internalization-related competence protein ComEC/Rec2 [Desulfatitalea sp.]NNJ99845.1 DNA internalization-related competence protein ComEC/Rec2 [Desulfatitalea sp.]
MASAILGSQAEDGPHFLRPLIPMALAFVGGIGAGSHLPGHAVWVSAVAVVLAGILAACILKKRTLVVLPLAFVFCCGYLAIHPWFRKDLPADHVAHFVDQGQWRVAGTVLDCPKREGRRTKFILGAERLSQGTQSAPVSGRIAVTAGAPLPVIQRGDRLTLQGRLRAVHSFCNPGGFDYKRFMALQGIRARLYTQGKTVQVSPAPNAPWRNRLDMLRQGIGRRMDKILSAHSKNSTHLLKALTLGDRSGIPDHLRDTFSRAGASHILAISGLHVGMVAAATLGFFRFVLVWLPPLRRRAWVKRCAAALCVPAVAGYALLAGLSPATQRAAIMVMLFLLTFWIGRRSDWANILAFAALLMLTVSPAMLNTVSFQLSFAAVLAIFLGMHSPLFVRPDPQRSMRRRLCLYGVTLMCISIWAVVGTGPLVMRYFNQMAWIGPITNLQVVPMVGLVVLPAGLLGILVSPVSETCAALCWHVAAYGLDITQWWVATLAWLPFAASTTVTPTWLEMGLFYLLVASLVFWKKRPVRIAGLCIVLLVGGLDAAYWVHRRHAPRLRVTAVDVGQGSANLLQLPGGFTVLVDGGGFSDNSSFDVGRSVLTPLLGRHKIRTIDLIMLTHPNSDHLNGLLYLLDHFTVGQIWSNHEPVDTLGYRKWRTKIAAHGIAHRRFDRLPVDAEFNGVRFHILGPPRNFMQLQAKAPWRDTNNNSLVVRVSYGNISLLFTGDIEAHMEMDLVARHGAGRLGSTILMVPHHGSRSSSSRPFLEAVRPAEAIVSAGWQNYYHFPHRVVLQRLSAIGARIWRTDQCGAILIESDGAAYKIQTCRKYCHEPITAIEHNN